LGNGTVLGVCPVAAAQPSPTVGDADEPDVQRLTVEAP